MDWTFIILGIVLILLLLGVFLPYYFFLLGKNFEKGKITEIRKYMKRSMAKSKSKQEVINNGRTEKE